MKLKAIRKTTVVLLTLLALVSTALAYTVMYQLDLSNTMKLSVVYGLELTDSVDVLILSYDWNGFDDNEEKMMTGNFVKLHNVGNDAVDITWSANCPTEWTLKLEYDNGSTFVDWLSGDIITCTKGAWKELKIYLLEGTATVGLDYGFTLSFEIVE